jgi:threonine aldolase
VAQILYSKHERHGGTRAYAKELCSKFVSHDAPVVPRVTLLKLANYAGDVTVDPSGRGELVERPEHRICELLGKPAAVFMPAGKTAQNIALKLWCERSRCNRIAIHPRSHMETWEDKAYAKAFKLSSVAFGRADRQTSLTMLSACVNR